MDRKYFLAGFFLSIILISVARILAADPSAATSPNPAPRAWETAQTLNLDGAKVIVSKPILVARSSSRLWFPVIMKFDDGKLMALMSAEADTASAPPGKRVSWSTDGGLTWSEPKAAPALHGGGPVHLPGGDMLILPFNPSAHADGNVFGPGIVVSSATQEIRELEGGLTIGDWPRPMLEHAEGSRASFSFNRHVIRTPAGLYLGTLYGKFKETKRLALVAVESHDGLHWKVRGVVANDACTLKGNEGPNEAALARLKDGRITCIFRMGFNDTPYGQSFSADDGKTWSDPVAMDGEFAVCPCVAELANNALLLTGGRTGIYAWLNLDGLGKTWQKIDLQANHNVSQPGDQITGGHTTAYTHTAVLDQNNVLCIYDRIPAGWGTIAKTSAETNSVWIVRLTVSAVPK